MKQIRVGNYDVLNRNDVKSKSSSKWEINFKEISRGSPDENYAQNNWNKCDAYGDGCDQQQQVQLLPNC